MNRCCKILFCIFCCIAASSTHAQKQADKDSMPDYFKKYARYYRLPGQPDSATFFRRADSIEQSKKLMDSIRRKQATPPVRTILTYTEQKKKATRLRVA
jgi:hypothetical protein